MKFSWVMRHIVFTSALFLLLPSAHAGGLYAGSAPVASQSDADRAGALKNALAQVVIKLTGDASVLARPDVAKAVANAQQYVQQYQYTRDAATASAQSQQHGLTLVAQFDRDAVDKMLSDLGVTHTGGDAAQAAVDVQPQTYRVWVSGVRSAADYAEVVGTLARHDLVRSVQAEQTHADGVELRLDIIGPLPRLLGTLANGPLQVVNAKPPVAGVDALLRLQQP